MDELFCYTFSQLVRPAHVVDSKAVGLYYVFMEGVEMTRLTVNAKCVELQHYSCEPTVHSNLSERIC